MSVKSITKLHAVCPHCNETAGRIDHLKVGRSFGPWYCDNCNKGYCGVFNGKDTEIVKDPNGGRLIKTLTLLEYPPSDEPLRFIIEGIRFESNSDTWREDSRYYFEEHSCPTNWLGKTMMVSLGGDTDPHGFLRYVRDIDKPRLPDNFDEEDESLLRLFPEMIDPSPVKPDP